MPQALRETVRTVLDRPAYRRRASLMADEFSGIDTRAEILRIIGEFEHAPKEAVAREGAATVISLPAAVRLPTPLAR